MASAPASCLSWVDVPLLDGRSPRSLDLIMASFKPMASELFTDRLHLRPWRASDAEPHRQLWTERDRRSLRLIDADGRPTVDDLRERMAEQSEDAQSGLGLFAVERLAGADFIGYCGLIVGQASTEEPEIAYEFARRIHGNGYATEAARIVVAEAAATGRGRLWATVRQWNTPRSECSRRWDSTTAAASLPMPIAETPSG